jgi:hypothetical protein
VLLFRLKFTVALATGLPLLSLTVAVILEVFPVVIVDGTAVTITLPPDTPAVIVIAMLADARPDAALMVTTALENVVAVTVTVARPPTVWAWPLDRLAFTWSPGANAKVTIVPSGTLFPRLSTARAVMTVEPAGAIVVGFAVRARAEAELVVETETPALLLLIFEG